MTRAKHKIYKKLLYYHAHVYTDVNAVNILDSKAKLYHLFFIIFQIA